MIVEIRAYKCTFCKKIYQLQQPAKSHEKRCLYNPEAHACVTCGNFHQLLDRVPEYEDEGRFCSYYKFLHPVARDCNYWIPKGKDYERWINKPEGEILLYDPYEEEDPSQDV